MSRGGPERRARTTSHDSQPGAQQHQEAAPGRGVASHDQLKLTGNARFRARATPHRHIRLNGIALIRRGCGIDAVSLVTPGGGRIRGGI